MHRNSVCSGVRSFPSARIQHLIVCSLLALVAACGNSGTGGGTSPSSVPEPGKPITYTAIGASDAIGFGSSAPCLPFSVCPDGRGYVAVVARELGSDGTTVTVSNLGIPGTVLSPAIQAIGNQYGSSIPGNFLDQEMPFVPRSSTVVTVFAGGNDTNAIGRAVERGGAGGDPNGYIDAQVRSFAGD